MAIKLTFLGGVRTVTGSSHLIKTGESEILIDAGLFQGPRDQFYLINTAFAFNPHTLDALILSHAHIDHSGNIPTVMKRGLRCKIFTTKATKELCKVMLEDSGKIQEEDIRYVNKVNRRLGLPFRQALYTQKEAAKATRRFHSLAYAERFHVARDVFVTLFDAGHILGSSIPVLEIIGGSRTIRVGYAVDLGRKNLPLLNDPVIPKGLDYLILESTYGGRFHTPIEEAKNKLKEAIVRTVERKGKILIPSFSLERTQELLYFLNLLLQEKLIPPIPIYVDSPLATNITEVFMNNVEYLDEETRQAIAQGNSPFEFLNLRYIRDQKVSKALNIDKRPMIIIAGSGMCESGRILHHLKNNIEDSRNTILVVGYMAKDTLGKRIVDRVRIVRIFGVEYELNAEVVVINAFSGHADQNDLVDFASRAQPLKRIFLVHSDVDQAQVLQGVLERLGMNVHIPAKDEEVLLD